MTPFAIYDISESEVVGIKDTQRNADFFCEAYVRKNHRPTSIHAISDEEQKEIIERWMRESKK